MFAEGGAAGLAGPAERDDAVSDDAGEGAFGSGGRVVGVVAAHWTVNVALMRGGALEAIGAAGEAGVGPAGPAGGTAGRARAAALLVVRVRSRAVSAWIWRPIAAGLSPSRVSAMIVSSSGLTCWWASARRCGVVGRS